MGRRSPCRPVPSRHEDSQSHTSPSSSHRPSADGSTCSITIDTLERFQEACGWVKSAANAFRGSLRSARCFSIHSEITSRRLRLRGVLVSSNRRRCTRGHGSIVIINATINSDPAITAATCLLLDLSRPACGSSCNRQIIPSKACQCACNYRTSH